MLVRREFEFHRLNPVGVKRAQSIAESFSELLEKLEAHVGTGREASLCRTKLEEACFFAKKAMAIQPENQEG